MTRLAVVLAVLCCSRSERTDAPHRDAAIGRSCSTVLESSCDGGFAFCELDGACGCYSGPRLVSCHVPRACSNAVPSCREIGCTERDVVECALATGQCVCVGHVTGMRDECELDGC